MGAAAWATSESMRRRAAEVAAVTAVRAAMVAERLAVVRPAVARLAVVRLAVVRLAVVRLAVVRLAVGRPAWGARGVVRGDTKGLSVEEQVHGTLPIS
ncbi:hypothetical protein ASF23_10635 [Curtobacterium sp. Leaf261]|nr:hypothetical protein ASF23_10635 [Curtobacterium sp. Leaf261]